MFNWIGSRRRKEVEKQIAQHLRDGYETAGLPYTDDELAAYLNCGGKLPVKVWRAARWRAIVILGVERMKLKGVKSILKEAYVREYITHSLCASGCPADKLQELIDLFIHEMKTQHLCE